MGTYLLTGLVFTFFIEVVNKYFVFEKGFTFFERIICIILWPIFVLIFIYNLF